METKDFTKANEVLCKVADELASANGLIYLGTEKLTGAGTGFWANKLICPNMVVDNPIYISPEFEDDKLARVEEWDKDRLPRSRQRIDIDIHWANLRLNVRLKGEVCAFFVCDENGAAKDSQCFGDDGPILLSYIKMRVDELMGRCTKVTFNF